MKLRCLITLFCLAQPALWAADSITSPIRDFLLNYDEIDPQDVVRTEPDLNNDGIPEILLSYNNTVNGRQGNIWVVYRSLPGGGYERIDELTNGAPIEFHQKASALKKTSLGADIMRYSPGGAGRGVISSFRLGPSGMGETVIREISPQGGDASTYDTLFDNPATKLVYISEDAEKLRRKYVPLREWLRGMTLFKWCLYTVGLLAAVFFFLFLLRAGLGMIRAVRS